MFLKSCRNVFSVAVTIAMVLFSLPAHADGVTMEDVVEAADAGDYETAFIHLTELLEERDPRVIGFMVHIFRTGDWGHDRVSSDKSKEYLETAVSKGSPYANWLFYRGMRKVAKQQDVGEGTQQAADTLQRSYLETAASGGYPDALIELAEQYYLERDSIKAWELLERTSKSDDDYIAAKRSTIEFVLNLPDPNVAGFVKSASSGFPDVYSALAAYYQSGRPAKSLHYRSIALTYARLSDMFGRPYRADKLESLLNSVPAAVVPGAYARADEWAWDWAKDDGTFIGEAAAWCFENGHDTLSCITQAPADHARCREPYVMIGFRNYRQFPYYLKCRENRFSSE